MRKSVVVQISINRPYHEAYAILSEPRNFPRYSPVPGGIFDPVIGGDGLDWVAELPEGRRVMRFSPPNQYGVLDVLAVVEGEPRGVTTSMRLVPNDEGCELLVVIFQGYGKTDEQFASDIEWARADFNVVRSVVETF